MSERTETTQTSEESLGEDRGKGVVTIFMNNDPFKIHAGLQTVAHIKKVCKVPAAYVIEFVEPSGQLKLLPNDGSWDVVKDQRFISHVAGGGSS